jgi:DNA polymerase, archaea type
MSPRNALTYLNSSISVDIDKLDLDYTPEVTPPIWQPTTELESYENLSKVYLDIETTGLDFDACCVTFIGLKDNKGNYYIFTDNDERSLLINALNWLLQNKPNVLIHHNGFAFDLPFLINKWNKYGINHPFSTASKPSKITSASFRGQPIEYTAISWKGVDIIDTFQQIAIWDKSANKLDGYGLKNSVIALKLRSDRRLELSNNEIQSAWKNGDLDTIKTYLKYDLDDTELLADFLLPIVWYQMAYVPDLAFQQMATASPALKAQKVHQALIGDYPDTDPTMEYQGATVDLLAPGLHHNVAKVDVVSMYPSIMLRYGICSKKDPQHKFLGWLNYLINERLKLKDLAKKGNKLADHQQNAIKILVNGSYGFMGTGFYSYNDFGAAALVTAYGRKILTLMCDTIKNNLGTLIEIDSDGAYFSATEPENVFNAVCNAMPSGINIELEMKNCGLYAPRAKNYIIIHTESGNMTVKGMFRKRNRYPLDNDFPIEYIKKYFTESLAAADQYFAEIIETLEYGDFDLDKLTVTRKIGKAEKKMVELGIGDIGDIVRFWYTEQALYHKKTFKKLTSKELPTTSGKYWPRYYADRVIAQRNDIMRDRPGIPGIPGQIDLSKLFF